MSEYMHLPDFEEMGEAKMEKLIFENCLPDGMYLCPGCKRKVKLADCGTLSPDPYATPFCPNCLSD